MIYIRELRVGNLVKFMSKIAKVKGVFYKTNKNTSLPVLIIDNDGVFHELSECAICPIKLTQDVLIECGFSESLVHNDVLFKTVIDGCASLSFDLKTNILSLNAFKLLKDGEYEKGKINLSHIITLHQLQNLYFILTGNDLSIGIEGIGRVDD